MVLSSSLPTFQPSNLPAFQPSNLQATRFQTIDESNGYSLPVIAGGLHQV